MFNKKLWKRKTMNNYKKLESGRSMIEMLGVLAIIGVLSVGGIAGYSKAMNKFKTNKVADNVSMLVANTKTLYAQQNTYTGLNNENAVSMGIVPDELVVKDDQGKYKSLVNAFNGPVSIAVSDSTGKGDEKAFIIEFDNLSKEACITLATNDWGSGYSSGLIAIRASGTSRAADTQTGTKAETTELDTTYIGNEGTKLNLNPTGDDTKVEQAIATPGGANLSVPMNVSEAAQACSCDKGNTCSVMWKYY